MKRVTITREYDDAGRLVREVVVEESPLASEPPAREPHLGPPPPTPPLRITCGSFW